VATRRPVLGILGGMGPLATADFYTKLVKATPASRDQDHVPVIIVGDPGVPDRSEAILSGGTAEVLEALSAGITRLDRAGVDVIAIPCNTAHYWLNGLRSRTTRQILSIVDASLSLVRRRLSDARSVTVLATEGTLQAGIYDRAVLRAGLRLNPPTATESRSVADAIARVKAGHISDAESILDKVIASVRDRSDVILLACTELPLAAGSRLEQEPWLIDTTAALVDHCLAWVVSRRYSAEQPSVMSVPRHNADGEINYLS